MANILMSYQHYPISVAIFFKRAFKHLGHKVFTVGPYHERIPWAPGMDFSKYYDKPDLVMPEGGRGDAEYVFNHPDVQAFDPDVLYQFDAAYFLKWGDWKHLPVTWVHIATDPHCIDYTSQFRYCDYSVSMQHYYISKYEEAGKIQWVPYAFDPRIHYWNPMAVRSHDITMISGLLYPERRAALQGFMDAGLQVKHVVGVLYEDGTEIYNKGLIAFNWSSQQDLPMRFWEGLAYRNVVLTNRAPDLQGFPALREDVHYLAFSSLDECIDKAKWAVSHPEAAQKIADLGYAQVWIHRHTYNQRALQLLRIAAVVD